MLVVRNARLAENRGQPRVWMQGIVLKQAGFLPGQTYRVEEREDGSLLLALDAQGQYLVSGKGEDRPVIDLNSQKLLGRFAGLSLLRVVFGSGVIHLSPQAIAKRLTRRLLRLSRHVAAGMLTTASLAGGGGVMAAAMDSGLAQSGLRASPVIFNEIREDLVDHVLEVNPAARAELVFNLGLQEIAFDPSLLARLPECDVLEMGLPCSGASIAGKSKRKLGVPEAHPEVGHLVAGAITILAKVNPSIVVLENVCLYEGSGSAAILRNTLTEWGYEVHERTVRSDDFGDLEARQRYLMVAVTQGLSFDFDQVKPGVFPKRHLSDIMERPEEVVDRWSTMDGLRAKEMRDRDAGKGFAMQIYDGSESTIATLTKGITKNRSTDPKFRHPTDPNLLRIPTAREHARAKGVPERLIAGLSQTTAHEMLGQGVCWKMIQSLFEAVGQCCKSVKLGTTLAQNTAKIAA